MRREREIRLIKADSIFPPKGAQHACAIARSLGIKKILIHKYASILSAYGLSLANVVHEVQEPSAISFTVDNLSLLKSRVAFLRDKCLSALRAQRFPPENIVLETFLNMRYNGTDSAMMTLQPPLTGDEEDWNFPAVFLAQYKQEFGFTLEGREILIDDIRIRGIGKTFAVSSTRVHKELESLVRKPRVVKDDEKTTSVYWGPELCAENNGRLHKTPVYQLTRLAAGDEIFGPALIIDATATIVVEPNCTAVVTSEHVVILIGTGKRSKLTTELDPIQLSIFAHRFMSIAGRGRGSYFRRVQGLKCFTFLEQMGRTLQKTAISTNIKERLDFSCALFGPESGLVANAPHIPVHLGSMQEAVKWQMKYLKGNIKDGDVILTNHPAAGGSHLPDVSNLRVGEELRGQGSFLK